MVRTIIQLTERMARRLREQAQRQGISRAELIRRSLEQTLAQDVVPDQQEIRQRARRSIGDYSGPLEDVARHHDRYLTEAYEQ